MDSIINPCSKDELLARFPEIHRLTEAVLETPLPETLQLSPPLENACPDSKEERLNLLRLLFNYSRREKEDADKKESGTGRKIGKEDGATC